MSPEFVAQPRKRIRQISSDSNDESSQNASQSTVGYCDVPYLILLMEFYVYCLNILDMWKISCLIKLCLRDVDLSEQN